VEALAMSLLLDNGRTPAQRTDFGITSDDHYQAMCDAIDESVETQVMPPVLVQLDQALGDGVKLTAFVKQYTPHWGGIAFTPPLDGLPRGEARSRRKCTSVSGKQRAF